MKHYYFKLQNENKGFESWKTSYNDRTIELSIYYGDWLTEDYKTDIYPKIDSNSQKQIDTFFDLKKYEHEGVYFWIFSKEDIYCFKTIDLNVYNGKEEYSINAYYKKEHPKSIKAEIFNSFQKIKLPEFFSNINSNQYYNRGTIRKLKDGVGDFANALINRNVITITAENFFNFISPIQFETLLFLIFNTENSFCSSFRGGTLKDYDLRIDNRKPFHGIPVGKFWLQAKLKKERINNFKADYLVFTGKTDFTKNYIGADWILSRIRERHDILNWIKNCLFESELFDLDLEKFGKVPKTKYISCVLGGAIGDALGAPIEFMNIGQIQAKYGQDGITDFVEFGNRKGEFTDDTQLTLFTSEALLRAEHRSIIKGIGGALNIIAHHSYLRWLFSQGINVDPDKITQGVIDIQSGWLINQRILYKRRSPGNTCISSLTSGKFGSIERPINDSKGCGTIMRVAPVGLMYFGNAEYSFKVACELSAITHGHPTGYLSAGFFAGVISELAVGVSLLEAIKNVLPILKKYRDHNETLRAVDSAIMIFERISVSGEKTTPEVIEKLGQGWTAEEALAISLFASLIYENDFEKGVLFAVNHSGDSDSTGSITGNILGLINGMNSIPKKWIENLEGSDIVCQIGEDLYIRVKGDSYNTDKDWWEKYPGY